MIVDKELLEEFQFMGIEGLGDEIIIKCIEIGAKYKINEERLVEEWIAFAQTNLNGNLTPTTVTLDMMVRKQFEKKQEKLNVKEIEQQSNVIKVYNKNNSTDIKQILNTYNAGTPKKNRNVDKQEDLDTNSSNFSPASYNPSVGKPSTAYAERSDRGEVLDTFGAKELLAQDAKNISKIVDNVHVKLLNEHDINGRYMFEALDVEATSLNDRIEYIGHLLQKKSYAGKKHENSETKDELSVTYGRVRCEGDGRLNAYSVLLETSVQHGNGQVSVVNLRNLPQYSLFPGQVIMLNAKLLTNSTHGNVLFASALHSKVTPELPVEFPSIQESSGPLKIIVACGPYTLSDNLAYQPLQDLVKYVLENRPHVLILVGPFVDKRHSSVADMADTFHSHFESLMEKVTTPLQHTDIQVIVIPSSLDAHHHSVYPTPPFDPLTNHQQFSNENVHMAPDPSLIDINGLVVGVTSADVLFHLAKTELNFQPENSDRMARFAEHVLSQRCFYPIYPPQTSATGERRLPVDVQSLNDHAKLDVMPHVLILPSNLKQFVKNVNGCIVINPERLSKGFVGGTFACVNVYPGQKNPSVADNITCRIIKI